MTKRGFTLVELLAVIAILAVLAVFVTPRILDMYTNSKTNANKVEVQTIAKTAEEYYVANRKNNSVNGSFNGKTNVINQIPLNGRKPNGKVTITKNGVVSVTLIIDGYEYTYKTGNDDVAARELSEEEIANSGKSSPYEFSITEDTEKLFSNEEVTIYKIGGDNDFFTMDDLAGGYYTFGVYSPELEISEAYQASLTEEFVDIEVSECEGNEGYTSELTVGYSSVFHNENLSVGSGTNNLRLISFELGAICILEDMDAVNYINEEMVGEKAFSTTGTYYVYPNGMFSDVSENIKFKLYWSYDEQYNIKQDKNMNMDSCQYVSGGLK